MKGQRDVFVPHLFLRINSISNRHVDFYRIIIYEEVLLENGPYMAKYLFLFAHPTVRALSQGGVLQPFVKVDIVTLGMTSAHNIIPQHDPGSFP
jgi:hypothetical protein